MERDENFVVMGKQILDFNSHAHVERDLTVMPAWYATLIHFNSHAHVERDSYDWRLNPLFVNFNSHAHVERDFITLPPRSPQAHFNSHAHVERDMTPIKLK